MYYYEFFNHNLFKYLSVAPLTNFLLIFQFGNTFLNRLQASYVDSPYLKSGIGLIDTPGVLAGQKQTAERMFNFTAVIEW